MTVPAPIPIPISSGLCRAPAALAHVTGFEFRLHPVGPEVELIATMYALEDGERVLRGWREFIAGMPMWSIRSRFHGACPTPTRFR
ncbi:MAG: hypothetical protein R2845_05555 [Thermomicrobiales bacterium]